MWKQTHSGERRVRLFRLSSPTVTASASTVFESLDIRNVTRLRPEPLTRRFVPTSTCGTRAPAPPLVSRGLYGRRITGTRGNIQPREQDTHQGPRPPQAADRHAGPHRPQHGPGPPGARGPGPAGPPRAVPPVHPLHRVQRPHRAAARGYGKLRRREGHHPGRCPRVVLRIFPVLRVRKDLLEGKPFRKTGAHRIGHPRPRRRPGLTSE